MAGKKRQCGTCRFFVESEAGGHGKCTHPKRDKSLREMVLLRPNELGCRTRWGTSLWQDPADESDPFAPETPQQPTLPDPIPAQLQYDDEVTSVSIAGSKTARSSFEDDVVDSGATGSSMGSWSDSLQEERRRLLMNSDRDAVAGARKRHLEKQAQQRELIPFADDDDTETAESEADKNQSSESDESLAASKQDFPPDDYVEEEHSADKDEPSNDDEIVDEGVRRRDHRSPRMQKLLREKNSPKNDKAMRLGASAEMSVTFNNPEKREKYHTVPSILPGVDLPFLDAKPETPSIRSHMTASAASMSMTPPPSRPVSQARELVSEDRLRQQRSQRQVSVPMAEDEPLDIAPEPTPSTVTNRPRLAEAPPRRSAPVDRLKSSPLRGYHPAVKAAAARAEENEAAERQPRFRPQSSQPTATSQPQAPVRPFTSQWQSEPAAPTQNVQQVRENRSPLSGRSSGQDRERQRATRDQVYSEQRPQPRAVVDNQREVNRAEELTGPEMKNEREPAVRMNVQEPSPERRRQAAPPPRVQPDTPYYGEPIEISPSVPRACATCASFRPGSVGGRGSCANEFAGPVQRVVFEQDLACEHTYGSLWIPADDRVWLEDLDLDYPPTPRVDAMLAKRQPRKTVVLPDLEELTS